MRQTTVEQVRNAGSPRRALSSSKIARLPKVVAIMLSVILGVAGLTLSVTPSYAATPGWTLAQAQQFIAQYKGQTSIPPSLVGMPSTCTGGGKVGVQATLGNCVALVDYFVTTRTSTGNVSLHNGDQVVDDLVNSYKWTRGTTNVQPTTFPAVISVVNKGHALVIVGVSGSNVIYVEARCTQSWDYVAAHTSTWSALRSSWGNNDFKVAYYAKGATAPSPTTPPTTTPTTPALGANSLYYIKTKNTGTGVVEVHSMDSSSNYTTWALHAPTAATLADAANGTYQMVGKDLYYIKTKNTGSGKVEVHVLSAASGYKTWTLHAATADPVSDAAYGIYQMVGKDLYYIKTKNTGTGVVEVHSMSASSNYASWALHAPTAATLADAANGTYQIVGKDLYYIKTKNTGSGKVEVHVLSAASGYKTWTLHAATADPVSDAAYGIYQMVGKDLYYIKTKSTGTGKVEVHSMSASNYGAWALHAPTVDPQTDVNGLYQIV